MQKTETDALVQRAIQGNGNAFTELWDTNIAQLRTYLHGWMGQVDSFTVDDICSRSFEKAFRQICSFDPSKASFGTWLRSIAHNTALDVLESEVRAHPRHLTVSIDDSERTAGMAEAIQDDVDTPLESIIRVETRQATAAAIDALPELYRNIARRRLLDGLQYKEIAAELGMELNTVRTRIRRAKMLIDQMSREEDGR